ncbi:MAG TPA: DUF501 domain-containing protein [Spirochaetota bacterium]|nr:DUF501 domain-containing protein [Spirochaetota bacterium]HPI89492.1 DUF501 domain-containing protein [Spirochaetota bacterium]HPR49565.1 DUF501 domain-containing protein [Spirochaetota bacterium]
MHEIISVTDRDKHALKKQLGIDNINPAGIVERCPYGYPSIIMLHPLGGRHEQREEAREQCFKRITNLLWLTCPYLNKKIHDLESQGYINRISSFISGDTNLVFLMKEAHADYHYLRKNLCRKFIEKGDDVFFKYINFMNTGIGGIKNIDHLKCLHLHYAHYRVCEKNVAGKIVYHLLNGTISCNEVLCENRS